MLEGISLFPSISVAIKILGKFDYNNFEGKNELNTETALVKLEK